MTEEELGAISGRIAELGDSHRVEWRAHEVAQGFAIQYFARGEYRDEDTWYSLGRYDGLNKCPVFARADAEFIANARKDVPALVAEVRRLRADNERLRGLVKQAEAKGEVNTWESCPWCNADMEVSDRTHAADCPAFNPDGTVR